MGNKQKLFKYNGGFTLAELLVVIAIISLLSSITLVYVSEARERARIAKIRQFATSIYHSTLNIVGNWDFEDGYKDITENHDSVPEYDGGQIVDDKYMGKVLKITWDEVLLEENPDLESVATGAITVEAWVKNIGESGVRAVYNPGGIAFALGYLGWGEAEWVIRNPLSKGCNFLSDVSDIFLDGKWNHLAGTYDGVNKSRFFINGQEITDGFTSINGGCSGPVYYSEPISFGGSYTNGYIDGVRVYFEALSDTQIKKHYVEGAKRKGLLVKE